MTGPLKAEIRTLTAVPYDEADIAEMRPNWSNVKPESTDGHGLRE